MEGSGYYRKGLRSCAVCLTIEEACAFAMMALKLLNAEELWRNDTGF